MALILGACASLPPLPGSDASDVALVSPFTLWVGACFDDGQDMRGEVMEVRSCAQSHDNEVFAVVLDPAEPGAPFPGNKHIETIANRECLAAFRSYVGIDYESSRFIWSPLVPDERTWDELDDRRVVCVLYDADFAPTAGTARGSRQ